MGAPIRAVPRTEELIRVLELPRRPAPGTPEAKRQAEADNREFTRLLVTPEGRRAGVSLVNWQGYALREIFENRGAYLMLPVGAGKTLISLLAPYVLDAEDPLLVVPAALRQKTHEEFHEYRQFWKSVPISILATSDLYQDGNVDLLLRRQHDMYGLDEADMLSNQESSATVRLARDIRSRSVPTVTLTGTGGRWSISDFSHQLVWALGAGAPVPRTDHECAQWGKALDGKDPFRTKRFLPGALHDLGEPFEESLQLFDELGLDISEHVWARLVFQRRLRETPGVVIVDEDSCDQPLTLRYVFPPGDARIDRAFRDFEQTQCASDGWELLFSLEQFSYKSQIGCGIEYVYDPRPPYEWVYGRREWRAFCKAMITYTRQYSRKPLDTEKAVKRAFRDHDAVQEWAAIEPLFDPDKNSKAVWFSDSVVKYCATWLRRNRGLLFCRYEALGRRIAAAAGVRYFGASGLDDDGYSIQDQDGSESAVLSLDANKRGRNLQAWCKAAVVGCPQSARDLEQLLGRLHRYGQERPVEWDIIMTSGLSLYSFDMAIREARFVLQTQGQTQKILRANILKAEAPSRSPRWALPRRRAA